MEGVFIVGMRCQLSTSAGKVVGRKRPNLRRGDGKTVATARFHDEKVAYGTVDRQ